MPKITLTIDLTAKNLEILKLLVNSETENGDNTPKDEQLADEVKEKKTAKKSATKSKKESEVNETPAEEKIPAEENTPNEEKAADSKIDLSVVRAAALKLSKAGKKDTLKAIFAKYDGASKLTDVPEEYYPALLTDLEEANG